MMLIQVISILFALFMLYVVRIHYRKQHIETLEYWSWTWMWVVFAALATFPESFQGIAQSLRVSRVFDLLVVLAMMILVFLVFQNRMLFMRLEKKIEQITRQQSILSTVKKRVNLKARKR